MLGSVSGPTIDPRHVEAALAGDDVAVRHIVGATQADVRRLCALLGSGQDADDLVQETYLRAFASLAGYRGESSVRVWLLSIARHVCADHVRREQRRRRTASRFRAERHALTTPAPEAYGDLLSALDDDRRDAFVLTQLLALSYEDAAEVLQCPIGTIRSRVARARAELVAALDVAAQA
jgi:RNA polymerase sigma-70 factor (ECF subfamily)